MPFTKLSLFSTNFLLSFLPNYSIKLLFVPKTLCNLINDYVGYYNYYSWKNPVILDLNLQFTKKLINEEGKIS